MEFPELNKILATAGKDLEKEINFLLALAASQVKKVIGKIMKFDQKVTVSAGTTINLIEFYQEGRDDIKLSIGNNFKQVLNESTQNGKYAVVDISGEVISQYSNKLSANDYEIMADMQESFIPMSDDAGRAEIRKRLAIAAYCMQLQPKGERGILQNNENVTIIGYFLMKSGSGWDAIVCRYGGIWHCGAGDNLGYGWDARRSFWSRNDAQ